MPLRLVWMLSLPLTATLLVLPGTPSPADPPRTDAGKAAPADAPVSYQKQIAPLLQQYCVKCHGGAKPKAQLALDRIKTDQEAATQRKTWDAVIRALQAHEMPPAEKPQPRAAERDLFLRFLGQQLAAVDCTKKRDPGRVTIRRLNRVEYNNTIRDLLGVTFNPADDFPADDVGYGFDNIGDVLTMSPILLEKYLSAAERIVGLAVVTSPPSAPVIRFSRRQLTTNLKVEVPRFGGAYPLNVKGDLFVSYKAPSAGTYVFRVRAYGRTPDREPVRMSVRIADKEVAVLDVKASQGSATDYEVKVSLKPGNHRFAVSLVNPSKDASDKEPKKDDRTLYVQSFEIKAPVDAALPETHRRIFIARPGDGLTREEAARRILHVFARKAYRRPPTDAEITRLLRLVQMAEQQGDSFEKSIAVALQAILVSPHFLFRIEHDKDPKNPEAIHPINEHELATRLSYFLWSSMPDEELFALADKGQLRQNLDAQVKRMLQDARAQALVENFGGQWLQTRSLKTLNPDPGTFPTFDEALRAAMAKEVELFFAAIIKEDRSILDFIDADFTYVNRRLAEHYGIRFFSRRGGWERISTRDMPERGGVLTMASTLMVTSNPTRTSPVKRGKWILENILNAPPPPPPPDVPELKEEKQTMQTGSLRKRMEQHRVNPNCASCHAKMDPLGFGFENFDGIGAWRTKDGQFPVEPDGVLPTGETFKGPRELKAILKKREEQFARCLSEKLLTYALGRGVEYYDRCAIDDMVKSLKKDQYRFSTLVSAIVKSEPFQLRRGKRGDAK